MDHVAEYTYFRANGLKHTRVMFYSSIVFLMGYLVLMAMNYQVFLAEKSK